MSSPQEHQPMPKHVEPSPPMSPTAARRLRRCQPSFCKGLSPKRILIHSTWITLVGLVLLRIGIAHTDHTTTESKIFVIAGTAIASLPWILLFITSAFIIALLEAGICDITWFYNSETMAEDGAGSAVVIAVDDGTTGVSADSSSSTQVEGSISATAMPTMESSTGASPPMLDSSTEEVKEKSVQEFSAEEEKLFPLPDESAGEKQSSPPPLSDSPGEEEPSPTELELEKAQSSPLSTAEGLLPQSQELEAIEEEKMFSQPTECAGENKSSSPPLPESSVEEESLPTKLELENALPAPLSAAEGLLLQSLESPVAEEEKLFALPAESAGEKQSSLLPPSEISVEEKLSPTKLESSGDIKTQTLLSESAKEPSPLALELAEVEEEKSHTLLAESGEGEKQSTPPPSSESSEEEHSPTKLEFTRRKITALTLLSESATKEEPSPLALELGAIEEKKLFTLPLDFAEEDKQSPLPPSSDSSKEEEPSTEEQTLVLSPASAGEKQSSLPSPLESLVEEESSPTKEKFSGEINKTLPLLPKNIESSGEVSALPLLSESATAKESSPLALELAAVGEEKPFALPLESAEGDKQSLQPPSVSSLVEELSPPKLGFSGEMKALPLLSEFATVEEPLAIELAAVEEVLPLESAEEEKQLSLLLPSESSLEEVLLPSKLEFSGEINGSPLLSESATVEEPRPLAIELAAVEEEKLFVLPVESPPPLYDFSAEEEPSPKILEFLSRDISALSYPSEPSPLELELAAVEDVEKPLVLPVESAAAEKVSSPPTSTPMQELSTLEKPTLSHTLETSG